jgi:hypothetical protein
MDRVTEHTDFLRYQAARQILRHLFGGGFQANAVGRYQTTNTPNEDYMARDAMPGMDEETQ